MEEQREQLLLQRFRKVKLLERTYTKSIWLLVNVNSGEKAIAKIQPKSKLQKTSQRNVLNQASYQQVMQGHIGTPFMFWSGVDDGQIIVISQYLGLTLQDQLKKCSGKFSIITTCLLGIQMIKIIFNYHQKGIAHRNIKPRSFQFGRGSKINKLYFNDLIDSKRFRNKKNHQHILFKQGVHNYFVNVFGSNNFKKNCEISRRDDIESIILMLIFFVTGVLPDSNNQFAQTSFPQTFQELLDKARQIQFSEEPNYIWFMIKLKSLIFHISPSQNFVYDWMKLKQHRESLAVPRKILSIKTELDKQTTKQLYDPYQEDIQIDCVSIKYLRKLEKEHNHDIIAQKKFTNSARSQKRIETHQKVQPPKKVKNSHKAKDDCRIM